MFFPLSTRYGERLIPLSQGNNMWYRGFARPSVGTDAMRALQWRARSLSEFQADFPDEASCAAFLFERRWP